MYLQWSIYFNSLNELFTFVYEVTVTLGFIIIFLVWICVLQEQVVFWSCMCESRALQQLAGQY